MMILILFTAPNFGQTNLKKKSKSLRAWSLVDGKGVRKFGSALDYVGFK